MIYIYIYITYYVIIIMIKIEKSKKHYLYYEWYIIDKKLKKNCIMHYVFIKYVIDILNNFYFLYFILNLYKIFVFVKQN